MNWKSITATLAATAILAGFGLSTAHATEKHDYCEASGKVAVVKVAPHERAKVIISELEELPRYYYRFWTDDDRVLTQIGSAHAGNHTVKIVGSYPCDEYDPGYKFDGGDIRELKVLSNQ
jgi:hypothetical protein